MSNFSEPGYPTPESAVHERPMIRVEFTTPNGQAHHSTFASTYRAPPGPQGTGFRLAVERSAVRFFADAGCSVTSINQVSSLTTELGW